MTIDRKIENAVMSIFPGASLGIVDRQLRIRTEAWKIDAGDFLTLQVFGLRVASVMIDGDTLTLIMTAKSTKTILR